MADITILELIQSIEDKKGAALTLAGAALNKAMEADDRKGMNKMQYLMQELEYGDYSGFHCLVKAFDETHGYFDDKPTATDETD